MQGNCFKREGNKSITLSKDASTSCLETVICVSGTSDSFSAYHWIMCSVSYIHSNGQVKVEVIIPMTVVICTIYIGEEEISIHCYYTAGNHSTCSWMQKDCVQTSWSSCTPFNTEGLWSLCVLHSITREWNAVVLLQWSPGLCSYLR